MKFGGAALSTTAHIHAAAKLVAERRVEFPHIVVVASAMGKMTDQLLDMAYEVSDLPPCREIDMLISAGERISIGLFAIALEREGVPALSLTGSQTGIITSTDHAEAKIIDVRPIRIPPLHQQGKAVVVAGFQGVSHLKEITTLGRGGSDTTAVALAVALGAERVEFYKDVDGIYDADPHHHGEAKHLSKITYEEALAIHSKTGGSVLHPRALKLAQKNRVPLRILPYQKENLAKKGKGSWIVESSLQMVCTPIYETV